MTGESFLYLMKVISSLFVRSFARSCMCLLLTPCQFCENQFLFCLVYIRLFFVIKLTVYICACVTQWSKYALVCKLECMRGCVFIPCQKSNQRNQSWRFMTNCIKQQYQFRFCFHPLCSTGEFIIGISQETVKCLIYVLPFASYFSSQQEPFISLAYIRTLFEFVYDLYKLTHLCIRLASYVGSSKGISEVTINIGDK